MSNPYFRFKQFTVFHDRCAMKVGVDGVLLGAWADVSDAARILDVGTGSGLIALMIAQRSEAVLDAVDIDKGAYDQTLVNVEASPWASRINVFHQSLQDFKPDFKYDLIVSNPPYFSNSLKSPISERNLARHADALPFQALLEFSCNYLTPKGRLSVVLPVREGEYFVSLAFEYGFHCSKLVEVSPMPHLPVKRLLVELCKMECETQGSTLTIEIERHCYSPEFTALAKEYYIRL